jgi:hypothetical protein
MTVAAVSLGSIEVPCWSTVLSDPMALAIQGD